MKKVFLILSAIAIFFTIIGFGFYGFSKLIYNSCSCERFNIDNIELRTGINIPKIKKVECNYNENTKTKKSSFIIDTEKVNLEDYILKNKLVKSGSYELYIKSNDTENHSYKGILDKNTGELDIEIIYKNK